MMNWGTHDEPIGELFGKLDEHVSRHLQYFRKISTRFGSSEFHLCNPRKFWKFRKSATVSRSFEECSRISAILKHPLSSVSSFLFDNNLRKFAEEKERNTGQWSILEMLPEYLCKIWKMLKNEPLLDQCHFDVAENALFEVETEVDFRRFGWNGDE